MRKWIKSTPPPDDPLAFRWWTFGALIFYTAALLVLCGVVAMQKYYPVDGLQGMSANMPITMPKIATLGQIGATTRTPCYQDAD
jgi:hypothetical protein